MPVYRLIRHVIYFPGSQDTEEVWGIDCPPPDLPTTSAPTFTDADDPLRRGACVPLLLLRDGSYVNWERITDWLSEAEEAGYELVSGYQKLSPYSTMIIRSNKKPKDCDMNLRKQ